MITIYVGMDLVSWWNGNLTMKQLMKRLVSTTASVCTTAVATVYGGAWGASLGAAFGATLGPLGPLGIILGSVLGSLVTGAVSGLVTNYAAHYLTDLVWPDGDEEEILAKRKTLHDAMNVLGCTPGMDLKQIGKRYRRLALAHHPDKSQGENHKQTFYEIVMAWEIVNTYYKQLEDAHKCFRLSPDRCTLTKVKEQWKSLEKIHTTKIGHQFLRAYYMLNQHYSYETINPSFLSKWVDSWRVSAVVQHHPIQAIENKE